MFEAGEQVVQVAQSQAEVMVGRVQAQVQDRVLGAEQASLGSVQLGGGGALPETGQVHLVGAAGRDQVPDAARPGCRLDA